MKLYIPDIGEKIKLEKDWTFTIYPESRNAGVIGALGYHIDYVKYPDWKQLLVKDTDLPQWRQTGNSEGYEDHVVKVGKFGVETLPVTLKKDTALRIDRIYIRKGAGYSDYSSVTFVIESCPDKSLEKKRFWTKLEDCNKIEYTEESAIKRSDVIELFWPYLHQRTLGTGVIQGIRSYQHRWETYDNTTGIHYVTTDRFAGKDRLFSIETIKKERPATEDEIDAWFKEEEKAYKNRYNGGGLFGVLTKPPHPLRPKSMVFVEYNKMHLVHLPTGTLLGKYTSVDSMRARARKFMSELDKKELEINLFNQ